VSERIRFCHSSLSAERSHVYWVRWSVRFGSNLYFWRDRAGLGELGGAGWIVYGGDRIGKRSTATVLPWKWIERLVESNL
jgi:hypothetical protein